MSFDFLFGGALASQVNVKEGNRQRRTTAALANFQLNRSIPSEVALISTGRTTLFASSSSLAVAPSPPYRNLVFAQNPHTSWLHGCRRRRRPELGRLQADRRRVSARAIESRSQQKSVRPSETILKNFSATSYNHHTTTSSSKQITLCR